MYRHELQLTHMSESEKVLIVFESEKVLIVLMKRAKVSRNLRSSLKKKMVNNIYLFKVQYPMYIKIRVQWTYNDIHNNHGRYTS